MSASSYMAPKFFKAGDVIKESKPIAHCVGFDFKGKVCDNCIKESDSLKKCSKCYRMHYCSKECQTSDWVYHRKECKVYAQSEFEITENDLTQRLFIRFFLSFKSDPTFGTRKHTLIDGSEVTLNELKDEDLTMDSDLSKLFMDIKDVFRLYGIKYKERGLIRVFKVFNRRVIIQPLLPIVKSVDDIIDKHFLRVRVGQSLFIDLTKVHSCQPNSFVIMNGLDIKLKAIEDIDVGRAVTMNLCAILMDKAKRNETIRQNYDKDCTCEKCTLALDEHIDYKHVIHMYNKNAHKLVSMRNKTPSKSCAQYMPDWQLFNPLQDVYGKYHPTATEIMVASYVCFVRLSKLARKSLIKMWYIDIEPLVLVSHGDDHPVYRILKDEYERAMTSTQGLCAPTNSAVQ